MPHYQENQGNQNATKKKKKKIEKRPTATVKCIRLLKTSLE